MGEDVPLGGHTEAVADWASALRDGPGALVIEGEAGLGKTSLWRGVMATARSAGYQTLSAQAARSEVAMSYAGLADLLATVGDDVLSRLPSPQAKALEVCLWRAEPEGADPDPRAVGTALRSLLGVLTEAAPVVIGVDDPRWLDSATRTVLSFAIRRLDRIPVGVVVSLQTPDESAAPFGLEDALGRARLWRCRLQAMSSAELQEMLEHQLGTRLAEPRLRRLHRVSGGNPLFALELARNSPSRESWLVPDEIMELPGTLAELMAARTRGLTPACRHALAAIAAVGAQPLEFLDRVVGTEAARAATAEAVDAGVLTLDGGRTRITHPLLGSAVYAELSPRLRRELHTRLAEVVTEAEPRARHRALAAVAASAEVAAELEDGALAAKRHGSPEVAGVLAEQAVSFTPAGQPDERARRSLQAVRYLIEAGASDRASSLVQGLVAAPAPGPVRVEALCLWAYTKLRSEDLFGGIELLRRARQEAGDDLRLQARIERDLAFFSLLAMLPVDAAAHAAASARAAETSGAPGLLAQATTLEAFASCVRGNGFRADVVRASVQDAGALDTLAIDYRPESWVAIMFKYVGDLTAARAAFAEERELIRAEGLEVGLGGLLWQMTELETWAGDLLTASRYAEEGIRAAEITSSQHEMALALAARARVRLSEGDFDRAETDVMDSVALAERTGFALAVATATVVQAELELCLGRAADAHARLSPLNELIHSLGVGEPILLRSLPLAAEALVALGRQAEADEMLGPYTAKAQALGRLSALGLAGRVRGLALASRGHLDEATEAMSDAVACSEGAGFPLDAARTQLCLGRLRRRSRDRRGARSSFESALAAFQTAPAPGWAARAADELARVGLRRAPSTLNRAEATVAALAASGHTNNQIARKLEISRRTVEANLARAYNKLHIGGRAELAAALEAAAVAEGSRISNP